MCASTTTWPGSLTLTSNRPTSLSDLIDPVYSDLLAVQNPATSSPGLAFLLATIDEFGDDGWQDYWTALRSNGVQVFNGWTESYYGSFTGAGGSGRPLVVSYGSSPTAEVIFAEPARKEALTAVIESTMFPSGRVCRDTRWHRTSQRSRTTARVSRGRNVPSRARTQLVRIPHQLGSRAPPRIHRLCCCARIIPFGRARAHRCEPQQLDRHLDQPRAGLITQHVRTATSGDSSPVHSAIGRVSRVLCLAPY